jgi:mannose-1-phosphate guanylyltransferase
MVGTNFHYFDDRRDALVSDFLFDRECDVFRLSDTGYWELEFGDWAGYGDGGVRDDRFLEVNNFVAIIAAGGESRRLQPLTDENHPKWLLNIDGKSLLEQTVERIQTIQNFSNKELKVSVIVITSVEQADLARNAVKKYADTEVIFEPTKRNTYATLILGSLLAQREQSTAQLGFFPADHRIQDTEGFVRTVIKAIKHEHHGLTTIGIEPSFASREYGYIETENDRVLQFVEKPNLERAQEYIRAGNYLWNSGMILAPMKFLTTELKKNDLYNFDLVKQYLETGIEGSWNKVEKISADYKFLEPVSKTGKMRVVRAEFDWSDIGDFEALKKTPIFNL